MAKAILTLVLPGLAPVFEQKINASIIPPTLDRIISKASFQEKRTGLSRLLFNLFSKVELQGDDLPIRYLESGSSNSVRADPCYLHADRDRLLLFTDNLALSREESAELIAEIQPLLDEFKATLSQSQADAWILELESMPEVSFSALSEVTGKGIENALPKGKNRQDWIRLWNEIQMKLFSSEINQRRAENKQLPINSVWFWGAGSFEIQHKAWQSVQGESSLLEQLAIKSQCPINNDTDYSISSLSSGKNLWLINEFDLENDWLQQLENVDRDVLKPLWELCRAGKVSVQLIIPDYGYYSLNPIDCWKFWKK